MEKVVPVLRSRWPVFTLGNYQPQQFTGPAIWIRCLLAQKLPEGNWKPEQVPVVYLPAILAPSSGTLNIVPKSCNLW